MKLICLNSGSNANCYFLKNKNGEILILDAGSSINKIMCNEEFTSFQKVMAVLVTHCHKDHSLEVERYIEAGLNVCGYMNLEPLKKYKFGSFEIIPFLAKHDVKNFGFIINNEFVYVTDFASIPKIKGIKKWLIECNYNQAEWDKKLMGEDPNYQLLGRISKNHCSLEWLSNYFSTLEKPEQIILCHLSVSGNADKYEMINQMSKFTDLVSIATKNKIWEI